MLSVIVPLYNPDESYLKMALSSLNDQDIEEPVEVILSDNGGGAFCMAWEKELSKLNLKYYLNLERRGIFSNINFALTQTQGRYVCIFCQDDCMFPDFLKQMSKALDQEPSVGMIYNQYDLLDQNNQFKRYVPFSEQAYKVIPKETAVNAYFRYGCFPGNLSTVMFRKSLVDDVGVFDESLTYSGDFEYWVRIAQKYDQAILINPYIAIRQHSQQASHQIGVKNWFRENTKIYKTLLVKNTIPSTNALKKMYLNQEIGGIIGRMLIKALLKGDFTDAQQILNIINPPLNIFVIMAIQALTLLGKYKLIDFKKIHF